MPFRWFLQSWLHRTVAEAAQEQIVAARKEAEQAAAHPHPCDVGIVFALRSESGGLEDVLKGVVHTRAARFAIQQGQWRGRHVVVAISGAGRDAARKATDALILGHHPRWVISSGFCGGLNAEIKRNDIVIADSIASGERSGGTATSSRPCSSYAHEDVRMAPDPSPFLPFSLSPLPFDAAVLVPPPRVHVGRLLTVDRIVRRPANKRELGERCHALAADLESFAVAEVCRGQGVPCLAIRVVSDAVDDELPREVEHLARQTTRAAQWGAAFGAFLSRPGVVKDLYKLKEDALAASDCLGRFLTRVIERL